MKGLELEGLLYCFYSFYTCHIPNTNVLILLLFVCRWKTNCKWKLSPGTLPISVVCYCTTTSYFFSQVGVSISILDTSHEEDGHGGSRNFLFFFIISPRKMYKILIISNLLQVEPNNLWHVEFDDLSIDLVSFIWVTVCNFSCTPPIFVPLLAEYVIFFPTSSCVVFMNDWCFLISVHFAKSPSWGLGVDSLSDYSLFRSCCFFTYPSFEDPKFATHKTSKVFCQRFDFLCTHQYEIITNLLIDSKKHAHSGIFAVPKTFL
jgi:hypothetical protein